MRKRLHTYTAYGVGCAIVWAVIWIVLGITASAHTRHIVLPVFGGWVIGWVSATIARSVYPPPGHHAPDPSPN